MKELTINFFAEDSEYFTALRLVAGTVCSAANKDVDEVEDFKVCVTEAALILKNNGFKKLQATFSQSDVVRCVLRGFEGEVKNADNDLSVALIGALVNECELGEEEGVVSSVTLGL